MAALLLAACGAGTEQVVEVNPSSALTTPMPACGAVLVVVDGTEVFSNGEDTGTGISCNGEGKAFGNEYQCVELAMRDWHRWDIRFYGNARDLPFNAPLDRVEVYVNGDRRRRLVPHDWVVWTNGLYGHVAVVVAVRDDEIDIIEQNVRGNGRATLSYKDGKIGGHPGWTDWVPTYWLHAKANTAGEQSSTASKYPSPGPDTPYECVRIEGQAKTYALSRGYRFDIYSLDTLKALDCVQNPISPEDLVRYPSVGSVDGEGALLREPGATNTTIYYKHGNRLWAFYDQDAFFVCTGAPRGKYDIAFNHLTPTLKQRWQGDSAGLITALNCTPWL